MKNKASQWLGALPAAVVAVCVASSLSGYTKPVFNQKNISSDHQADDSSEVNSESEKAKNSSDT